MLCVPGSRAAPHFLSAKSLSQNVLCFSDSCCCCCPGCSEPLQFPLASRCTQEKGWSRLSWVRIPLPVCCLLDPASCLLTCLASDWPSFVPLLSRTPTSALCPSHCTQVRAVCLLDCFLSTFGRRCLFPWFLVERNSFKAESLGKTLLRSPPSGFFLPCSFNPLLLYLDGRNYCASCMPPLGQFRMKIFGLSTEDYVWYATRWGKKEKHNPPQYIGFAKSSFGFFHNILGKNLNELLGQSNTQRILEEAEQATR